MPVTGDHRDHVAASFEVRVLNWMLVPAGVVTTGSRLIHARLAPPSIARDVNEHVDTYGDICSQSSEIWFASGWRSLASGRIAVENAAVWVATCTPSTQYTTCELLQSIRKRCGEPMNAALSTVSVLLVPSLVRALSVVPSAPVLNIAHGAAL